MMKSVWSSVWSCISYTMSIVKRIMYIIRNAMVRVDTWIIITSTNTAGSIYTCTSRANIAWWNAITCNPVFLLIKGVELRISNINIMLGLYLLFSDLVKILLLDSGLLNSFLSLLELESMLFSLNFAQFSLNISIVNFTVAGCLNSLEKVSLFIKFVLASSFSNSWIEV